MASKIDNDIYSQVKRLEIETNRIINAEISGNYLSAFKGRGIEFDEVRPYIEGDDVRFIDWNVTARMNEPFIKIFREERELTVFLIVDMSASLSFGSTIQTKRELMMKITALLSLVSMKNNDRVGLIIFSDRVHKIIPPRKGRKHVLRTIEELLSFKPKTVKTDINSAIEKINKLNLKRSVIFLLSDFLADFNYSKSLEIASKKHDLVPILIKDPLEEKLKGSGFLRVEDSESGETFTVNLDDEIFLENYSRLTQQKYHQLKEFFIKLKADIVELKTGQSYLHTLITSFKKRSQRRQF